MGMASARVRPPHFGVPAAAWLKWGPTSARENAADRGKGRALLLSARARKAAGVRCCYLV